MNDPFLPGATRPSLFISPAPRLTLPPAEADSPRIGCVAVIVSVAFWLVFGGVVWLVAALIYP